MTTRTPRRQLSAIPARIISISGERWLRFYSGEISVSWKIAQLKVVLGGAASNPPLVRMPCSPYVLAKTGA
jgi:hypothetical protein